jgi:hypothetical protein
MEFNIKEERRDSRGSRVSLTFSPPFGQAQVSARCADKGCGLPWTRFKGLLLTPGSKAQEQPDAN